MAYGVTQGMIATYGDLVFDLSLNKQVRRGDPVRALDFEAIEAGRAEMGLSDEEIAPRLGLTAEQVRFIRVVIERRRFRTDQYRKLFALGGGRRYREERYRDAAKQQQLGPAAMRLREAMGFAPERVRRYVEAGWWADDTLSGWLTARARASPEGVALVDGEETIAYGELAAKVERLAGALLELGLGKGDVVAVQLPNSPEFVLSYLALGRIGAVMTTLHMGYRAAEIETQLGHSQARAVIAPDRVGDFAAAELMLAMRDKLPALDHVIVAGAPAAGALALSELVEGGAAPEIDNPPVAADPFLLLYTSGTTARPKAVPLSYQNMLSNARLSVPEFALKDDDAMLSAAPFSHLFGLYSIHLALAVGARMVLLRSFTPKDFVATIEGGRASVLFAAPAHVAACLGADLFEAHELSSVRLAIVSGSACAPDLARAFDAKLDQGRMMQLWGMTELQAGLYTRPDDPLEVCAKSAGRPSPGTEVRIVGAEGAALAPGEEGELEVRGCSVFPGYLDNDEANADSFSADGWFRSGDLAVMDEGGNVRLSGRVKDIVNRGGVKINPLDVETLIDRHPAVAQSAIVAMADPVLGERACCFALLAPGAALTLDELCAFLEEQGVAKLRWPERLEIVDEMPLTPTRKVIKGRLKARLDEAEVAV